MVYGPVGVGSYELYILIDSMVEKKKYHNLSVKFTKSQYTFRFVQ